MIHQETLNYWKQVPHVLKFFRETENPTARLPENFMQGFLEVRTVCQFKQMIGLTWIIGSELRHEGIQGVEEYFEEKLHSHSMVPRRPFGAERLATHKDVGRITVDVLD